MSVLALAGILDTAAATPLHLALLGRVDRREPILLDGSAVIQAGQACLQIIASAAATAASTGLAYALNDPSDELRETAALARLETIFAPLDARTDR